MESKQKLKAVLVGCGSISEIWLQAAKNITDLELVGFIDIVREAAQRRAEEYGAQNVIISTDLTSALRETTADIVFNCTVPGAHAEVTLEALRYGCHVLSEKPLAHSMKNAKELVAAAQDSGKIFAVMQNRRYDPNIRRLRNFLASGAIGCITMINSDFYIGAHFSGFRNHMQHVLLLDMAIHTFDAARFITGSDAVSVYCKEWNPPNSWYDRDASAVAIFEMTNNIVYTYRGSWCAEGLSTAWEADWHIIGEKGSVRWNGSNDFQAQTVIESDGFLSKYEDVAIPLENTMHKADGHVSVIREFIDCVRHSTTPETVCTDNIKSLAIVFGAIESAERGSRLEIKW